MEEIEDVLNLSYKTLNELQTKLSDLDKVHQDIIRLKDEAILGKDFGAEIPKEFQRKFNEIKILSSEYLKNIGVSTNTYFEINNKVYLDNQHLFVSHIKDFQSKNTELQNTIDALKIQIIQLQNIDFENEFNKLQTTLSKLSQKLDSLIPSLLAVKNTVDNNHIAITKILNSFSEATLKHFKNQVSQTEKSRETLHTQINLLKDQNSELKKAIATNRIIQIVGFLVIAGVLIYLITKP